LSYIPSLAGYKSRHERFCQAVPRHKGVE